MNENYNKNLANNVKSILSEIGENSEREGLLKTDKRKRRRRSRHAIKA